MISSHPTIYYVFLDMANVVCHQNIRVTKSIVSAGFSSANAEPSFRDDYLSGSADYFPFIPNQNLKPQFTSSFNLAATSLYTVEYNAERTRRELFPLAPSRLSAVFAFATEDDCSRASSLYGWNLSSVRRFRLIPHPLNRVARVNMEIVSLMRFIQPRASFDEAQIRAVWSHYWNGRGAFDVELPVIKNGSLVRQTISAGEIWEYLIEGRLDLEGSHVP